LYELVNQSQDFKAEHPSYTETPLKKGKPKKSRSHFEKTYKSGTSMEINFFFSINTYKTNLNGTKK
jgi:hypothetical protein